MTKSKEKRQGKPFNKMDQKEIVKKFEDDLKETLSNIVPNEISNKKIKKLMENLNRVLKKLD